MNIIVDVFIVDVFIVDDVIIDDAIVDDVTASSFIFPLDPPLWSNHSSHIFIPFFPPRPVSLSIPISLSLPPPPPLLF